MSTMTPEGLLNLLLQEVCTELCFRVFQQRLVLDSVCPHCRRCCRRFSISHYEKPGLDIYGNKNDCNDSPPTVECPCCKKMLAATRFAPHLEKCMGMGRQSSRKRGATMLKLSQEPNEADDNDDGDVYSEQPSGPPSGQSGGAGVAMADVANLSALNVSDTPSSQPNDSSKKKTSPIKATTKASSKNASPTKNVSTAPTASAAAATNRNKKAKVSPTKPASSSIAAPKRR